MRSNGCGSAPTSRKWPPAPSRQADQAILACLQVRLQRGGNIALRGVYNRYFELQHVNRDPRRLCRRTERRHVDDLRLRDKTLGNQHERLRSIDIRKALDQAHQRIQRLTRIRTRLLSDRTAFLLDLHGARIPEALRRGNTRRILDASDRLAAFPKYCAIQPGPAPSLIASASVSPRLKCAGIGEAVPASVST